MPVVPLSPQPKRKPLAVPDSKYLLMAMGMMHNEGKLQPPQDSPQPEIPPQLSAMMK